VTNTFQTIATFSQFSSLSLGLGEGNLSDDDRYWPLVGTYNGGTKLFVYDMQANTVTGMLDIGSSNIDCILMSRGGNYVVVKTVEPVAGQVGTLAFSRTMKFLRKLNNGDSHGDLGYDTAGNEVYVGQDNNGDRALKSWRLDNGAVRVEVPVAVQSWMQHTSTRGLRGWALVTSLAGSPASNYDWSPNYNEAVMVKLDGSGLVQRWAQLHHSDTNTDYARQPHGTIARDGQRILWVSDWGNASTSIVANAFVADRR
jgi:hypothetical protein